MNGERRFASQGHSTADLARKLIEPLGLLLEHSDDGGVSSQGRRSASFERGPAQERASLERGTIGR
jgi:hypothetical protein